MKTFLFIVFLLLICNISSNYTFELIEEIVPKTIIFRKKDYFSFKIFKYIPLCSDSQINNSNKNINVQVLGGHIELYRYDDYFLIGQNSSGSFINFQKHVKIDYSAFRVFSYDISCDKDYYFVLSYTSKELLYEPH